MEGKKHTHKKIAFGHQCACAWIAGVASRCQEGSKHHGSYTEFPEPGTPNDVIIYALARVAARREEKPLFYLFFLGGGELLWGVLVLQAPPTPFKLLLAL